MAKPGRPAGSRNRKKNVGVIIAQRNGTTPLEYLLDVMDDKDTSPAMRMEAAKAAAPYVHARLSAVTVQEKPYEGDPNEITSEYLAGIIARGGSSDVATTEKGKRTTH